MRAGGSGRVPRLRTPRLWTATRTPPGLGLAAALGGQAELGKPRSRHVALSLQLLPAGQPRRTAPLGPGLRSPALLAAV